MVLSWQAKVLIFIFIAGGAVAFYLYLQIPGELATVEVVRGDIRSEVEVTGRVHSPSSVNLAFESGGKIDEIYKIKGDRVNVGDLLTDLNRASLMAELRESEALIDIQQIKLNDLESGIRNIEVELYRSKVKSAEKVLADARKNLADRIYDAYLKSDDAIRVKSANIFIDVHVFNPKLSFFIPDSSLKSELESLRIQAELKLKDWFNSVSQISDSSNIELKFEEASANTIFTRNFLDKEVAALTIASASASVSQSTIDTYLSNVSTARANLITAIINLTSANEKFRSAESALDIALKELAIQEAGFSDDDIAAQEAQLRQYVARRDVLLAEIAKTKIISPIKGVITNIKFEEGEIVAANQGVITVISETEFEIEADVPEIDIGNIMRGDKVEITLDAFPGEIFMGHVGFIDPAETITDGVVNFSITVLFDKEDSRIKSGLTANLSIITDEKVEILLVPGYVIIDRDAGRFVRKIQNGLESDVLIETGLRSLDGMVEVLSGLEDGDRVVNIGIR